MTTSSQQRESLDIGLLHHQRSPASSLVCEQMTSVSATGSFPAEFDVALVDASGGAVTLTLPPGGPEYTGRVFAAVKTDAVANAVTLARAGSDMIEAGTSLSTTTQHDRIAVEWDGTMWRRPVTGSGGGSSSLGNTVINGTLQVTGNAALNGTTTLGTGGSAALLTPGPASLALAKSLDITGGVNATQYVAAPLIFETKAAVAKAADTGFDLATEDRMLTISTTGAGVNVINPVDTLEVGQEISILMTAAGGGGTYTLALAGGKTATFAAAGDSLQIKHYGGGLWASIGGTAAVA